MKRTILFSLFALLLVPALAIAETSTPVPAAASQGCDPGLSFLSAASMTPATDVTFTGIEGTVQAQTSCCAVKRRLCRAGCACGVFEFNCDPATCQSSCICNICP